MREGSKPKVRRHEIVVVGGGLTGLTASMALARAGHDVGMIAPEVTHDPRTTALMAGSVELMRRLDVWPRVEAQAQALEILSLVDRTDGVARAPLLRFFAHEIGLESFGHNVPNPALLQALEAAAQKEGGLTRYPRTARRLDLDDAMVRLVLDDETCLDSDLVVGADGRNSLTRRQAGIAMEVVPYPQVALACRVRHVRPHGGESVEFHFSEGPCTFVPMPGLQSALVWVRHREAAERLRGLSSSAFVEALSEATGGHLGVEGLEGGLGTFPLSLGRAESLARGRVLLLGEAAHVLPPIGAQGLNLGLRDVVALVRVLEEAEGDFAALGSSYERARRSDLALRRLATDLLNRLLLSRSPLAQMFRVGSMGIIGAFSPARKWLMRKGVCLD